MSTTALPTTLGPLRRYGGRRSVRPNVQPFLRHTSGSAGCASTNARIEQAKRDWKEGRFPKVPGDEIEAVPLPE